MQQGAFGCAACVGKGPQLCPAVAASRKRSHLTPPWAPCMQALVLLLCAMGPEEMSEVRPWPGRMPGPQARVHAVPGRGFQLLSCRSSAGCASEQAPSLCPGRMLGGAAARCWSDIPPPERRAGLKPTIHAACTRAEPAPTGL